MADRPGRDQLLELLRRAVRYALSLIHDEDEARAAAHDAFVRLAERGGPWEVGYVLRTVRNLVIDEQRRKARRRQQPLGTGSSYSSDSGTPAWEPADPSGAPSELVGHAMDVQQAIGRVLAMLAPEERELLYLADVEEMTGSEIAELTGRSRASVLAQLSRLRARVRDRLPNPFEDAAEARPPKQEVPQ